MGNTTSGEAAKKTAEQEEEARKASEAARAAHNRSLKPKLANGMTRILDAGDLMFLNTRLPVTPRASVWSALYLSYRDGKSFTSLVHSVRNIKNTLIIIKDDGGQVFGLFAGDQWKLPEDLDEEATKEKARAARESRMGRKYVPKKSEGDANFFGDGNCALVGIKPDQSLHRPTRQNSNFMYLQTKWPEKEANGLAMGGMMYNFGVRLDDGLEHGYFRGAHGMCMTFNSPCLAHAPDFKIMDVEAWALGDEALDASGSGKASALDSKEALKDQKILEFAGREFHREQAD